MLRLFNKKEFDFRDAKSSFCFMDETGLINSPTDKFFAIGIIKISRPEKIYNKIRKLRQRLNYNEELKRSNINRTTAKGHLILNQSDKLHQLQTSYNDH